MTGADSSRKNNRYNMEEIIAITPKYKVTRFDIMKGDKFKCQVTLKLTPGMRYEYNIIKQMAVLQRPSLQGTDFDMIPTNQRV